MTKRIDIKAGETMVIYRRNLSSVPMKVHFEAIAQNGNFPIGEVEVRGSHWILPKSPKRQPLQAKNTVNAGVWDTFLAIVVTAHTDLTITLPERSYSFRPPWLWGIVAVIVIAALLMWWLT